MRFKNTTILYDIILLFGATQCHTQSVPQIKGNVAPQQEWKPMLYLIKPRNFKEIAANFSGNVIDSAVIAPDGSFSFSKLSEMKTDVLLEFCIQKTGARFFNQLYDDDPTQANYMPIVLQNGVPLVFQADAAQLPGACLAAGRTKRYWRPFGLNTTQTACK